jgi:cytochrome c oxidase assembly protein subunit 11
MNKNVKIALIATIAPIIMFGAAYAGVPLYKLFCEQTGYGGYTKVAKGASSGISQNHIKVRFDANVMPDVKWQFKANQNNIDVKMGQNALAFYTIKNNSDREVTAIAEYNVTPHKAAQYFQKLECFCFQNQTLKPGESLELPVLFFVDKRLGEDNLTKEIKEVTLSYTFMNVKPENISKTNKNAQITSANKTKS